MDLDERRPVGREVRKSHLFRIHSGFYEKYCNGTGMELGHQGYAKTTLKTIHEGAYPLGLEASNYDGIHIPIKDNKLDFLFSSHVLEHIMDYKSVLKEWHRSVKIGGYVVIIVPHMYLYEKKKDLPSRYNSDHKRFYTPSSLLAEVEEALVPNSYRVVHCRDWDVLYDYTIPPEVHAVGSHEIELVIKKIRTPDWSIE